MTLSSIHVLRMLDQPPNTLLSCTIMTCPNVIHAMDVVIDRPNNVIIMEMNVVLLLLLLLLGMAQYQRESQ